MWGLFVRKHAAAVAAQGAKVHVLYAVASEDVAGETEYVRQETDGVVEHYAYYRSGRKGVVASMQAYCGLVRRMEREGFKPEVIQVNVIGKEAMLAYLLHRRYGCPYVVMEHWSGYQPENGGYRGAARKAMTRFAVRHSECLMPISSYLQDAMTRCGVTHENTRIVYNVVDDFFYRQAERRERGAEGRRFRFIHVSCFENRSKNVLGIVGAAAMLKRRRSDFELLMVGCGVDYEATVERARELHLDDNVRFTGEQTPMEVCGWLEVSDAFVLFSNYDNTPVVLEESMAVGCPIISSPVGIAIKEVDEETGMIVPRGDEGALAEAMERMMERSGEYDREHIRQKAEKYTYAKVGAELCGIYREAMESGGKGRGRR